MAIFTIRGVAQDPDYNCVNEQNTTSSTFSVWDWQQRQFNDIYVGIQNNATHLNNPYPWSPFFEPTANLNVFPLTNPQNEPLDFQVADGWELVKKNFGTPTTPVSTPYFILYNKYKSILRVFMYIQPSSGYNSAYIHLMFNNNSLFESALL